MTFAFSVEGTPVGWRAPSPGRRGQRHHSPPEMRAYMKRVALTARAAMPAKWPYKATSYRVDINIYQHGAKPDAGNVEKLILDALTGIAYVDDCRVDSIHVVRFANPRIECVSVHVEALA